MSRERVYACVSGVVPCRFMTWGKGGAPALPWAVYFGERDDVPADDGNYCTVWRWTVELYEKTPSTELEQRLHDALQSSFGYVRRGEDQYIENEGATMTPFYFTEIGEKDEQGILGS